jgi:hypothetical protein
MLLGVCKVASILPSADHRPLVWFDAPQPLFSERTDAHQDVRRLSRPDVTRSAPQRYVLAPAIVHRFRPQAPVLGQAGDHHH